MKKSACLLLVAFGAAGAQDRTYSVTDADSTQLHAVHSSSLVAALAGKVPGGRVVSSSNLPGIAPTLMLRGAMASPIGAPIIVVDDVPTRLTLADLNVDDVEHVEILKGAAAGARFGIDGANGAILVSTKRGRTSGYTIRSDVGINSPPRNLSLSQHQAYLTDTNGVFIADFGGRRVSGSSIVQDRPFPAYLDMRGAVLEPRTVIGNHASMARHLTRTQLFASLDHEHDNGVVAVADGYARRNARLNVDHVFTSRFQISAGGFLAHVDDADPGAAAAFNQLRFVDPDTPLDSAIGLNPLYQLRELPYRSSRDRHTWNLEATYAPLSWLSLQALWAHDRASSQSAQVEKSGLNNGERRTTGADRVSISEFSIAARRSWLPGVLETTTRLAVNNETQRRLGTQVFVQIPAPPPSPFDPLPLPQGLSFGLLERAKSVSLSTDGRFRDLTFDALVRLDTNGRLASSRKGELYHRLSAAYRLGDTRIRLAHGTAAARGPLDMNLDFLLLPGCPISATSCGTPLRFPYARETEAGIGTRFLRRYTLDYTFSHQRTKDDLRRALTFTPQGFVVTWSNVGTLVARSHELLLGATLVQDPALDWRVSLSAHHMRARMTSAPNAVRTGPDDDGPFIFQLAAGETMGTIYGARYIRTEAQLLETMRAGKLTGTAADYALNEEGYYVAAATFHTASERPLVAWTCSQPAGAPTCGSPTERVKIGDLNPDVDLGLNTSLRWRSFSAHATLSAVLGGNIYNMARQQFWGAGRDRLFDQSAKPLAERKPFGYYLGFWGLGLGSEIFVEDGSFLKLTELSVDWRLPVRYDARIGLTGRNLFTVSRYSGYDPDAASATPTMFGYRIEGFGSPVRRTVGVALKLGG
ncbi:MAG TPA: TonB-dependent receptor plug domain-containing protein [Gemmatimonadaceae bacterium]|nr:TonB-dependent receptor plug domain-containing protein [Gemmatimonadaceae bacterium]